MNKGFTYEKLDEYLGDRVYKLIKKTRSVTIANRRDDGSISIRHHETEILTYYPDGKIVLENGGWYTSTTKTRMNEYLPNGWSLYQRNHEWWLTQGSWRDGVEWAYDNGMVIDTVNDTVIGAMSQKELDERTKLNKRIRKYAKEFARRLVNNELPAPSGGDCWYCASYSNGSPLGNPGDHIPGHLDEGYYVPSMMISAFKEFGNGTISQITEHMLAVWSNGDSIEHSFGVEEDQIRKCMVKYLDHHLLG